VTDQLAYFERHFHFGLPLRHRDFHLQNKRKPARRPQITVSGLTISKAFRTSVRSYRGRQK
jgi:hypothetical protein